MIKVFCDLCKKEIDDQKFVKMVSHTAFFDPQFFDICPECIKLFGNAVYKVKEEMEENK